MVRVRRVTQLPRAEHVGPASVPISREPSPAVASREQLTRAHTLRTRNQQLRKLGAEVDEPELEQVSKPESEQEPEAQGCRLNGLSTSHRGGRQDRSPRLGLGAMAVQIDTSRALRLPDELAALVSAVLGALPVDELDWIEWKSGLDLSTKSAQGTVARHILGMANRQPDAAASYMQGCGYFVVGAEPGNASGVVPVDPAQLSQGIVAYAGSDGPAWSRHYPRDGSVTVLVVVVEPPQSG